MKKLLPIMFLIFTSVLLFGCEKKSTKPKVPSWHIVDSPTTKSLNSVYFVTEDDGWAVGNSGTIVHYDGSRWSIVESPTEADLHSVYLVSPNDGWIVGNWGTILRYDGTDWQVDYQDSSKHLFSVFLINCSEQNEHMEINTIEGDSEDRDRCSRFTLSLHHNKQLLLIKYLDLYTKCTEV